MTQTSSATDRRLEQLTRRLRHTQMALGALVVVIVAMLAFEMQGEVQGGEADPADRERWRAGDPHREAAEDASPDHYRSVRIHHGVVPQGVRWSNSIRLLRTKYWDYGETSTGQPVWEAIRDLEPSTPAPRS